MSSSSLLPPLRLERNVRLLESLPEPKSVWHYFLWFSEIPRVSHKLEQAREKLLGIASSLGLEGKQDDAGNIVIRRPAHPKYASVPSVAIQCHMDMVTSSNEGTVHDFERDPLELYVDGEWLTAKDTTLGADNGLGAAACLALLSESSLEMGPIECLFTADEETTMGGAENIAPAPFLQSKYMINVDSEEEHAVCVGCAGGFELQYHLPVEKVEVDDSLVQVCVSIKGLLGGHTGIDINRGRGNALSLMSRILCGVSTNVQLVGYAGGTAVNTIPRECTAHVAVGDREAFESQLREQWASVVAEYKAIEPHLRLSVEDPTECARSACSASSTQKVFDFTLCMPDGVLRLNPHNREEVETSTSLSICELRDEYMFWHSFTRSSSPSQTSHAEHRLRALSRFAGVEVHGPLNAFPGWDPVMDSPMLNHVVKKCAEIFGGEPKVYSVHAGLECGLIKGIYPDMECVSIGPDIRDAHTPDEKALIPSTKRFFDLLTQALCSFAAAGLSDAK